MGTQISILPGKWGPRSPYSQENWDPDPHTPRKMGTQIPILLGKWGPGVPILGVLHFPMTPVGLGKIFSKIHLLFYSFIPKFSAHYSFKPAHYSSTILKQHHAASAKINCHDLCL